MTDVNITEALNELHDAVARIFVQHQLMGAHKCFFDCLRYVKQLVRDLATSLSIDLDEAKRVWGEYSTPLHDEYWTRIPALHKAVCPDIPNEILAMHADISEAWKEYQMAIASPSSCKINTWHVLSCGPEFRCLPVGFPICLARLYIRAEELEKAT